MRARRSETLKFRVSRCRYVVLVALAILLSCGADDFEGRDEPARALAAHCALRVTEALLWPAGNDETPWFELHQQGIETCWLNGAQARIEGAHGEPLEQIVLPDAIEADALAIVRSQAPRRKTRLLPAEGRFIVYAGSRMLAHFRWGAHQAAPRPIVSRAIALEPWHAALEQSWCTVQATPYDGQNMGSPGEKNPGCDTCRMPETSHVRPRAPPKPGELMLVALDVKFPGRNRGRQRATLRSLADGPRDVDGLELRVVRRGRQARFWRLLAPSCASVDAKDEVSVAIGSVETPFAGPWLFSGPTLPEGDAVVSLLSDGIAIDQAVVPRAQKGTPTFALRAPAEVDVASMQMTPQG